MKCLNCSSTMKTTRQNDVEIEICYGCGSAFFDQGEVQQYLKNALDDDEVQGDEFAVGGGVMGFAHFKDRPRPCPKCPGIIHPFNYAYDSNVILDRCKKCQGIWADSGEVRRLARFAKNNEDYRQMSRSLGLNRDSQKKIGNLGSAGQARGRWLVPFLPLLLLPLEDDNRREANFPWVTLVLSLAMFFATLAFYLIFDQDMPLVVSKTSLLSGLNFIPALFLHSSPYLLVINMLYMFVFADNIEDRMGKLNFLGIFMGLGLFSYIIYIFVYPSMYGFAIGSSGAVTGILGGYVILFPQARIKTLLAYRLYEVPAVLYLASWIGLMAIGVFIDSELMRHVWVPQLAGFVAGMSLFVILRMYYFDPKEVQEMAQVT